MVRSLSSIRSQMNRLNSQIKQSERKIKQSINNYNSAVRKYNANVRSARVKINNDLNKLKRINNSSKYYVTSNSVHRVYNQITEAYEFGNINEKIYDDIERENENNLELANVVLNNSEIDNSNVNLNQSEISSMLLNISQDLKARWDGALFSLSPSNPEAARHFCTSTREILKVLIDDGINNKEVVQDNPNCEKSPNGSTPSRRSKVIYAMKKKGYSDKLVAEFAVEDIENTISLITELSNGTHGSANKYSIDQLKSFKKRFENSIYFICKYIV